MDRLNFIKMVIDKIQCNSNKYPNRFLFLTEVNKIDSKICQEA
jgi:hypothetical protein